MMVMVMGWWWWYGFTLQFGVSFKPNHHSNYAVAELCPGSKGLRWNMEFLGEPLPFSNEEFFARIADLLSAAGCKNAHAIAPGLTVILVDLTLHLSLLLNPDRPRML